MFRDLVAEKGGAYDRILAAGAGLCSPFANLLIEALDYCHKRPETTGEVLWAKIREWARTKFDEPEDLPPWADLDLYQQAALDLQAAQTIAAARVIARFAPSPAPVVVIHAAPPKIEDTIFEQHGSLGERDEHRVQAISAVSRVLEAAGLDPKSVMKPEALDEISLDDVEDDAEGDEGDGEDGEGETGQQADAPAAGAETGEDFMPAPKRKAGKAE